MTEPDEFREVLQLHPVPWTVEQIDAHIRELCRLAAGCPGGQGALLIVALRDGSKFESAVAATYDPANKDAARSLLTAMERATERIRQDLHS